MTGIIGMAIGIIFGAGIVLIVLHDTGIIKKKPEEEKIPEWKMPEKERLKKQWENLMNYNGSDESQGSLEDDEY